jgi:hypothetical protein
VVSAAETTVSPASLALALFVYGMTFRLNDSPGAALAFERGLLLA